ncbi:tetratricopeptide repeat protein [Botrimarina hoheduenensis]|nr:outer membrane protein assembly factor BamD [Botrimarina hoheduenensis]
MPRWLGGSAATATDAAEGPGTPEWWRSNKKRAEFVPGEGFRVEGVPGFFDQDGRSIDAPVDEITVDLHRAEESKGILPGVDPKLAAQKVKEAVGLGPDQQAARKFLAAGVKLFEDKRYAAAAKEFEKAAARWPRSDIASLALFNQAESYYWDDRYQDASETYLKLLTEHPSTPKLDITIERMWAIAQYWEKTHFASPSRMPFGYNPIEKTRPTFDTIGNSIKLYDSIRMNDPTGPRADDSIMTTAGIYYQRQRYADADYHYSLLRQEYPRSDYQFEAHLLGLQAKLMRYQGPDYDGTPLTEARKLEERTRLNFSGRLSQEQLSRLNETRGRIQAMIEERDLRMAAYYEGTKQHRAARIVLNNVIKQYPSSPAAEKARDQLAKLEGLPDAPDEPMEWLVEMFPQNQERSALDGIAPMNPRVDVTRIAEQGTDGDTTTR